MHICMCVLGMCLCMYVYVGLIHLEERIASLSRNVGKELPRYNT